MKKVWPVPGVVGKEPLAGLMPISTFMEFCACEWHIYIKILCYSVLIWKDTNNTLKCYLHMYKTWTSEYTMLDKKLGNCSLYLSFLDKIHLPYFSSLIFPFCFFKTLSCYNPWLQLSCHYFSYRFLKNC